VSAEQARNRKRFFPVFQFDPFGEMRPDKLNRRYKQSSPMLCVPAIGLVGNGGQVVSEWLVSYAGAFYSLLAPEGKEGNGFTACVFASHNSITLFKRKALITKKPCRKTRTVRSAGQAFSAVMKSKLARMPRFMPHAA